MRPRVRVGSTYHRLAHRSLLRVRGDVVIAHRSRQIVATRNVLTCLSIVAGRTVFVKFPHHLFPKRLGIDKTSGDVSENSPDRTRLHVAAGRNAAMHHCGIRKS